jgi:hypothetical protein
MPGTQLNTISHVAFDQYKRGALKIGNGGLSYDPGRASDAQGDLAREIVEPMLTPEALKRIRIMEKLEQAWIRAGGARSPMGLPLHKTFNLIETPEGYVSQFRGGTVRMDEHADKFVLPERERITIRLVAMQCGVRSEKEDEIYGSVGVITQAGTQEFQIPIISLGKRRRIQQFDHDFDIGAPADTMLHAMLVEHDSGKESEIRERIKRFYDDVGDKVETASQALAGSVGEVGVDFLKDVLTVATIGVATLFDMGDDPFDPAWEGLSWDELMRSDNPTGEYSHPSDPQRGRYNWKLRCFEQGGNGAYDLFFSYRREIVRVDKEFA